MKKVYLKREIPLIIPAAGLGSRLFPVTWAIPKELLPIDNRPALHYVLLEAVKANISDIICITSPRKEALIGYLTYNKNQKEVPLNIVEEGRLQELHSLNQQLNYFFKIQEKPYGVGDAILKSEDQVTSDFFAIAYPDDILIGKHAGLADLIMIHEKYLASVILIEKVHPEKIHLYGVIGYSKEIEPGVFEITEVVEKPPQEKAPSLYGIIGRYIMHRSLFSHMKDQDSSIHCNIKAFNSLIKSGEKILGVRLKGNRYDIGTLPSWLDAISKINKI